MAHSLAASLMYLFLVLPINKSRCLAIETALFNNALVWFYGRCAGN